MPMLLKFVTLLFFVLAAIPFIYYGLAVFSCWRFFRRPSRRRPRRVHSAGQHPEAHPRPRPGRLGEFRQLLPAGLSRIRNGILRGDREDPALPLIDRLMREFPERRIRVLYGSGRDATNDKVAKLARLVSEAAYEHVVISDSDVRVRPDYLRAVIAPLADPKIGAVTCFYLPIEERTFIDHLQSVGMMSDFYPGIVVAWQLDGVKFALGPTIATTRERLAAFGGYESIENRPADDLLVGRFIADQGYEVQALSLPGGDGGRLPVAAASWCTSGCAGLW